MDVYGWFLWWQKPVMSAKQKISNFFRNSTNLNGYRSTPFELYIAVNWWIIWIIPDRASGMLSVYSIVTNLFYLGQLRGKCKPLLAISTAVKNVVYIYTPHGNQKTAETSKIYLTYLCPAWSWKHGEVELKKYITFYRNMYIIRGITTGASIYHIS